ncbi:MAG TPA: Uma2 family endonuclease [Gordonia sp. (in: high G+C Gram-positive bacteria)]|jgi:Uma2 family endonuclease|nr:Uma2 family endonuclease [Gordonia sp. (in: high G+C Gram-positive bacteria)]
MSGPDLTSLLSLRDWRALGEETGVRSELQEGVRIVTPRPAKRHIRAVHRLWNALESAAGEDYEVLGEIDIVIDAHTPATVRVPDLVVCAATAPDHLDAAHVLLAVEVISPGTRRIDRVMKRSEYADAGITHYWIVDLDGPRLSELTLTDGQYTGSEHIGEFTTTVPFAFDLDLRMLTR